MPYVLTTSESGGPAYAVIPMPGGVAGFVHSSSPDAIASFDPRRFKSRHLIVLQRMDACRITRPSNGEAMAYRSYNGIEAETVSRIKAWIAR